MTVQHLLTKIPDSHKRRKLNTHIHEGMWEIIKTKVKIRGKWFYLNFISGEKLHIGNPYLKMHTYVENIAFSYEIQGVRNVKGGPLFDDGVKKIFN